jgi:hypothetical protein
MAPKFTQSARSSGAARPWRAATLPRASARSSKSASATPGALTGLPLNKRSPMGSKIVDHMP